MEFKTLPITSSTKQDEKKELHEIQMMSSVKINRPPVSWIIEYAMNHGAMQHWKWGTNNMFSYQNISFILLFAFHSKSFIFNTIYLYYISAFVLVLFLCSSKNLICCQIPQTALQVIIIWSGIPFSKWCMCMLEVVINQFIEKTVR